MSVVAPFPPLAPEVMVSHDWFENAVHAPTFVAVTVADPVWAEAVMDAVCGAIVNEANPCCVTVNTCDDTPFAETVIVPVLCVELEFVCAE
jgi:hypothetical protein